MERIPGDREAVEEHAQWGERPRNVFVGVAALELLAIALSGGGELVYGYAGGVGTRSGKPEDVGRLLVAGLYNESQVARKAGRGDDANQLIRMLLDRNRADTTTRLM